MTGIEPVTPYLQGKQKFKLSRCFGCAYQFEVVLRLLQRCSKNAEKENTTRTGEYRP